MKICIYGAGAIGGVIGQQITITRKATFRLERSTN